MMLFNIPEGGEGGDAGSGVGGGSGNNGDNGNVSVGGGVSSILESIPEELKDKPYIQNLLKHESPQTEIWKQFAGIQEVLGRRPGGMPADDASDEDWNKWVTAIQPKDTSVYGDVKPAIPEDKQHLKEMIDASYDNDTVSKMLETFRENGVPKRAVANIMKAYNELQLAAAEKFHSQTKQEYDSLNKNFDEVFTQHFGNEKDKVLNVGQKFLKDNVPDNLKPHIDSLSNEALAVIAGLAYNIHNKYGKEDSLPNNSNSGGVGNDVISLKAKMNELMSDAAYANPMSPKHESLVQQVRELGSRLGKLTKPVQNY